MSGITPQISDIAQDFADLFMARYENLPAAPALEMPHEVGAPLPLGKSLEIRAGFYQAILRELQQLTGNESNPDLSRSLKVELAAVLEGFARMLKGEGESPKPDPVIDELKKDLLNCKNEIINLLNDRSRDQSQISRLETQLKFMPDLQSQADRVQSFMNDTGNLHEELSKVRFELNKAHLNRMRTKLHRKQPKRSWWSHLKDHFLPET